MSLLHKDTRKGHTPSETGGTVKQTLTDTILDFSDCIAELLCDGLSFESIDGIRVGRGGHDDKGDDSDC